MMDSFAAEAPLKEADLPSTAAKRRFSGKVAIVTGGASGIGRATAERLAVEGATVGIFDINETLGEELVTKLKSAGSNAHFNKVDVSDQEACTEAVKQFVATTSRLDYLVNCAAFFGSKGLTAQKKDWDKTLSVNVVGYSNMVQACHPYMSKQPGDKSIVNISSGAAFIGQPQRWTYSASKGAVYTMTKCMALDLSKDKIRVNSVSPAWVWGPEVSKAAKGQREVWEPVWGPYHLTRKMSERSEIASAICFLLSEDASCVTGTDLATDGGYLAMGPEGLGENVVFAGSDY